VTAQVFTHAGHRVGIVPLQPDGSITIEDVADALGAATRAVVTSTILPDTGFRHDLPSLAALCRSRGIWLIADASPSVGLLAERLVPASPDVLVCGLTGGAGVVYRRPEVAAVAPSLAAAPAGMPGAGMMALGGALDVLDGIGIDHLEARVHALTTQLHHLLDTAGLPVRSPRAPRHRASITIVGADDPDTVSAQLAAEGIEVTPCARGLRVSLHAFTREEDLELFVSALSSLRRGDSPSAALPHPGGLRICVDLNGVLDAYEGWRGAEHWDPPRPGAIEFLRQLRDAGCRVTIFTTRQYSGAWRWLLEHGMAAFVDDVTDRKPPADVFVDDHAVCFRGDFDALLAEVLAFEPHWRS
jgi:phosphoglycolate phosphatase-like HAD superfamily hydrolase